MWDASAEAALPMGFGGRAFSMSRRTPRRFCPEHSPWASISQNRLMSSLHSALTALLLPLPQPNVLPRHLEVFEGLFGFAEGLDLAFDRTEEVDGLLAHCADPGHHRDDGLRHGAVPGVAQDLHFAGP